MWNKNDTIREECACIQFLSLTLEEIRELKVNALSSVKKC